MSISVSDMQQRVASTLSTTSRVGYTLLAVLGAGMAMLTGALVATEHDLPQRTQIALAAMTLTGVAWTAIAVWVLSRRRVLFAQHRVVVTRVACLIAGVFFAFAFTLNGAMRVPTVVMSGLMLLVACAAWLHAQRVRARLMARRDALMKERA